MKIYVVTAVGKGLTRLSAFDRALQRMGVHNYNLILLSSIVPPQCEVIPVHKYNAPEGEYGHRLYVVKADIRSSERGQFIAAGLGWYQRKDGRGVFVEHTVLGYDKKTVVVEISRKIEDSVHDLCVFRHIHFNPKKVKKAIAVTGVEDKPACALAVAVYQAESWSL